MPKKVIVIGSGFAGLSAATHLAHKGYEVTILEKNSTPGGRARAFETNGFTFDMGPSWYWMPEVFEKYFEFFGKKRSDYYELIRLDPSYSVRFGIEEQIKLPASIEELYVLFESYEKGAADKLRKFLAEAKYKYETGMNDFVHRPGHNMMEFADLRILSSLFKLQLFSSLSNHVRKLFKNEKLIQILEFPVLFLGATPQNTPALYSLMNYADMSLGTWYPMGGMHEIIKAMVALAREKGVQIILNEEVKRIEVPNGHASKVITANGSYDADIVVGGADYNHIEQKLLPEKSRVYSSKYWDNRTMAPSSLLFYLGIDKKVEGLDHHNLFFDADFELHAEEIYEKPKWPTKPLFYVCAPSVTDSSVAPAGKENLFLLIPLAPDLEDTESLRTKYFNMVMDRLESHLNTNIRDHIIYKKSFAHNDFKKEYHAFKGNAYGLANTLMQTAFLKPKMKSKKVNNLFYTGQLTTPGPGVPPSLISGKVVAQEISKLFALS